MTETVTRCPFCKIPAEEHWTAPGYLHWTWWCPNAPTGWRGVFYDRPVTTGSVAFRETEAGSG